MENAIETLPTVEAELVRIVERLRAMNLGGYACVMHDGSTVKIKIRNEEEKKRKTPQIWDERIAAWLKQRHLKLEKVTIRLLLEKALLVDPKERKRADELRAAQTLRRLGWTEKERTVDEHGIDRAWSKSP